MDTGISQRHLSFVESGRSAPSRDFLSVVSDALNIPLRERNDLLLASGFAPQYNEQSIDAKQMTIVTRAIDRMLKQHEPHPALVLDRHSYAVRTNSAAPRFFGSFIDLEKWPKRLREYPGVAQLKPSPAPQSPVLTLAFRKGKERFSYFSLITTVGTPQCITAQELRVECMYGSNRLYGTV
jgi:transcriptional regulator with XRE-family HTH domain